MASCVMNMCQKLLKFDNPSSSYGIKKFWCVFYAPQCICLPVCHLIFVRFPNAKTKRCRRIKIGVSIPRAGITNMPIFNHGGPKNGTILVHFIISPNISRFSKCFHCPNQETICNKTIIIYPTTPQMCCYTIL